MLYRLHFQDIKSYRNILATESSLNFLIMYVNSVQLKGEAFLENNWVSVLQLYHLLMFGR